MPLYEYLCHSCGQTIEVIQKFSDEPLTKHEACGGELEKLISRSAIQFKGSGWYVTDYGKGGVVPKNNEGKSEGAKSESAGSESKAGDGKTSPSTSGDSKTTSSETASKPAAPAPASTT